MHVPGLAQDDRAERLVDEVELGHVDVDELEAGVRERVDRLAHARRHARGEVGVVDLSPEHADACAADVAQRDRLPAEHAEERRRLLDRRGQRPDVVAARGEREDALERDEPVGRLEADDPAVGGGDADRAAGVGAERVVGHARGDERGRAGARAAGGAARIERVEGHPERGVDAAGGVLEQVRLAEQVGGGGAQARDRRRVAGGGRRRRDGRGVRRHDAGDVDVVLDRDGGAEQRAGGGALAGRQLGDQRVQRRGAFLQALIRGEQLEVRDLARAPPGLDLADQLERAAEQRAVDPFEHRLLGRPAAHHQVAVDPGVGLRRAPVELDQPFDRAVEVAGVEAVERLDGHRRGGEHLARELHVDARGSGARRARRRSRGRRRRSRTASRRRPPSPRGSR